MKTSCASFHNLEPVQEAPHDRVAASTGGARLEEPTLVTPSDRPSAPTVPDAQPTFEQADEPVKILRQKRRGGKARHPEWCVDLGLSLQAMSTFDLWMAIARGSIGVQTMVWRDGMDCWSPIAEVPELSCAVHDAARFDSPVEMTAVAPPSVDRNHLTPADPGTPLTFEASEVITGNLSTGQMPARRQDRPEASRLPARSRFLNAERRGTLSIAIGSMVAVLAISAAIIRSDPAQPAAASVGPIGPAARAPLVIRAEAAQSKAMEAVKRRIEREERTELPPLPRPSHEELGQRRARRNPRR